MLNRKADITKKNKNINLAKAKKYASFQLRNLNQIFKLNIAKIIDENAIPNAILKDFAYLDKK